MECRGSVILGYLKYIKKTWGKDGYVKAVNDLNMQDNNFKEGQWYDIQFSEKLLEWIYKNKGADSVIKCGNYTVKDLGMFAYIVRFANIKKIISRAPESHSEAFRGGVLRVNMQDNGAIIRMRDTAVSDYSCQAWLGCFMGTLEMTNTKGTVKERQCQRKDGVSHCEFVMEWE